MPELVGTPRVLVVEDEYLIALTLEHCLGENGYRCIGPAKNVEEAMVLAERESFEAAILDARLGNERVDPVAATIANRGVPFAFAVGNPSDIDGEWEGRPKLVKPYTEAEVQNVLRKLLARGE